MDSFESKRACECTAVQDLHTKAPCCVDGRAHHMASVTEVDASAVRFKHFSELNTTPPAIMVGGLESACKPHVLVHARMMFGTCRRSQ